MEYSASQMCLAIRISRKKFDFNLKNTIFIYTIKKLC